MLYKTKVLFILALLCAVVQGVRSQNFNVWDGVSESKPRGTFSNSERRVFITTAAELNYLHNHMNEKAGSYRYRIGGFGHLSDPIDIYFYECDFTLHADLDLTAASWEPLPKLNKIFNGLGHTIRLKIDGATANYQGLFSEIGSKGGVRNLHIEGNIQCDNSRLVGAICGENDGTIQHCWVSANVSSDWRKPGLTLKAKVGGISGENNGTVKYCCMTGNVTNNDASVGGLVGCNDGTLEHCTFYGTRNSSHSQDNKYVGDASGTQSELHDSYSRDEYDAAFHHYVDEDYFGYYDMKWCCHGIVYPYAINLTTEREGSVHIGGNDGDYGILGWRPNESITRWHPGATITLTRKSGTVQSITITDVGGNNIPLQGQADDGSSYWFTMPWRDVNVHVTFALPAWLNHAGTENDPISIGSADDWNNFVRYVNNGTTFSGKVVRLTDNISVSQMVGKSDANSFQGTFDGDGKTLSVNYNTSEAWTAPFRHVKNATIKNLHVTGTITTSAQKAGGIVAESHGALTIENCRSSVAINSSVSGDGSHGGLVSTLSGADNAISIAGCVFDGSFATTNGTTNCGGFIGWPVYNRPVINNSLMKPSSVAEGMLNNTFARWHNGYTPTIQNCYFAATTGLPANQGKRPLGVTSDEYVTVSVLGIEGNATATYSVSGITAYRGGLACNGTYYYGDGDVVRLALSNTAPSLSEGLSYSYTASAGSLSGTKLTMPGQDVTIGLTTITTDWATANKGTEKDPYRIYTAEQLDLLAQRVNAGDTYSTKYFKLMNDIAYSHTTDWDDATSTENNFTAIGYYKAENDKHYFSGDFDGGGHTISGIRIYHAGSTNGDGYQGLFGYASSYAGSRIHDLTLADTRITGYNNVGGIVGYNYCDITNCHVTPTVAIHAVQADASSHGGIVGYGQSGSISYSTSAATLTTADASQSSSYGAICGHNQSGDVKNCLAIGATVPAAKDNTYGAICGDSYKYVGDYPTNIEANYYINCTVAGTANATGVGINGADLTDSKKRVVPAYAITTDNAENFSIEFNEGIISAGGGITFYDTGFKYDDVLYAAGGQTVSLTLSAQSILYVATAFQTSAGTLTGTENPYTLTMPAQDVTISVSDWTPIGLTPDADGNYLISSADDWNTLCDYVADGISFKDMTVRLTDDITVTTMVGTDGNHTFRGTFDGDGHTLTVNYTTDEQYAAPFRYTYGGTIKNLKTAGAINTSSTHAGGVVGCNGTESLTLQNVSSRVTVNSSYVGSAYHGGLMGYTINASLTGCAFTGRLLGSESHHIGGLLGQKSDTEDTDASFTNCLFAPAEVAVGGYCSYPFAAGAQKLTTIGDDCFYTTPMGGAQGTRIYTAPVADEINKQLTAIDDNTYYMPCTVSGIQEGYLYTGGNIEVVTSTVTDADGTVLQVGTPIVTMADGTELTLDTDYTVSTSPSTVKEKGNYTLTVSGKGNCSGSKSFSFVVGDYAPVISTTTTMETGSYMVYSDVTIPQRIVISGEVELYLSEGTTLYALKGIELSGDNRLTIFGPGALVIDNCDDGKSGIGAATAGTLTIRGGEIDIIGAEGAAGIGSDAGNTASGTLTLAWTDASDNVKCSSYSVESFEFSKQFVIDDEQAIATTDNIGGKRILPAVVLTDTGDNSDALAGCAGQVTNAALDGRTLYLDGDWNTICLPFDYPVSDLEGVEARTLTAASIDGTTLHLTFGDPVDELVAGTPYIIKFAKEDDYVADGAHDYLNPIFYDVTIDATDRSYDNNASGADRVRFIGTFAKKSFDGTDKSILFMGGENTLYYPLANASIGAQRAYFKIGEDGEQNVKQLTAFSIDFGDDRPTLVSLPSGREAAGAWYDLSGRKLPGKPSHAGVYINKGIKVVIK